MRALGAALSLPQDMVVLAGVVGVLLYLGLQRLLGEARCAGGAPLRLRSRRLRPGSLHLDARGGDATDEQRRPGCGHLRSCTFRAG